MKFARTLYHFLGGVYFALILITAVTLFVVAGTFIESLTQSHRYAALFTYDNPIFAALLWGFFINILFSATRRWPFRWKHIPFLITHVGLLMILAGVLAKHYFGVQGSMMLAEGSASHEIIQPNSYAVQINKKGTEKSVRYPLQKKIGGNFKELIALTEDSLSIRLVEFYPHCEEHLASWIKGPQAFIGGLKPIALLPTDGKEERLPAGGRAKLHHSQSFSWDLYAFKTSDIQKTLAKLFSQNATIRITNRKSKEILLENSLENFIKEQKSPNSPLTLELSLGFSSANGFQNPLIKMAFNFSELLTIPLNGEQALLNLDAINRQMVLLPIAVDIIQHPLLAVIEDEHETIFLVAFDRHGKVWAEPFRKGRPDRLVAYDDGFFGYTVRSELPFKAYNNGRQEREEALAYRLTLKLRQAIADGVELSPPLQMILEACQKAEIDFPDTATAFLMDWNAAQSPLFQDDIPLPPKIEAMLSNLEWKETPPPAKRIPVLSAYLRSYGIDFTAILNDFTEEEMNDLVYRSQAEKLGENADEALQNDLKASQITLETLVASMQKPLAPGKKLEDNVPKIILHFNKAGRTQNLSLAYDKTGSGLNWPILDGEYKVRFQPQFIEIPYRLRLRQARQINYANSSQPYSFESDLIFKDRRTDEWVEKTISMNNVHETWDGYRFYLSSITPPDESAVKHVQIAVNYDPAKYILTYPGAIILSCGMLLLFIMRPYRWKKS